MTEKYTDLPNFLISEVYLDKSKEWPQLRMLFLAHNTLGASVRTEHLTTLLNRPDYNEFLEEYKKELSEGELEYVYRFVASSGGVCWNEEVVLTLWSILKQAHLANDSKMESLILNVMDEPWFVEFVAGVVEFDPESSTEHVQEDVVEDEWGNVVFTVEKKDGLIRNGLAILERVTGMFAKQDTRTQNDSFVNEPSLFFSPSVEFSVEEIGRVADSALLNGLISLPQTSSMVEIRAVTTRMQAEAYKVLRNVAAWDWHQLRERGVDVFSNVTELGTVLLGIGYEMGRLGVLEVHNIIEKAKMGRGYHMLVKQFVEAGDEQDERLTGMVVATDEEPDPYRLTELEHDKANSLIALGIRLFYKHQLSQALALGELVGIQLPTIDLDGLEDEEKDRLRKVLNQWTRDNLPADFDHPMSNS